MDRPGNTLCDDLLRDEAVPLLLGPLTTMLTEWTPLEQPGLWNSSYGNPFIVEDWKPLTVLLAEGDKDSELVKGTSLFVNDTINVPFLKEHS